MINKFAGTCRLCGARVAAQAGECAKIDGQWRVEHLAPCPPKAEAAPAAPAQVGDLTKIMALFDKAKAHLKYPAIVLQVAGADAIRVSVAGEKAKIPGSLTVCGAERQGAEDRRPWFGRVTLDGHFQIAQDLAGSPQAYAIRDRLAEFACDPVGVAKQYAKATLKPAIGADGKPVLVNGKPVLVGNCMFCDLPLSDERSTAAGYGRTCARNWGLPWGAKPAELGRQPEPKAPKFKALAAIAAGASL